MPFTSSATSIPVGCPKPSVRHVAYRLLAAAAVVSPSLIAARGGHDVARERDAVLERHHPVGLVVRVVHVGLCPPSSCSVPLSRNLVLVVTAPLPRPAVAVSILNTEPGS